MSERLRRGFMIRPATEDTVDELLAVLGDTDVELRQVLEREKGLRVALTRIRNYKGSAYTRIPPDRAMRYLARDGLGEKSRSEDEVRFRARASDEGALGEGEPKHWGTPETTSGSSQARRLRQSSSPSPSAPWTGEFDDAVERGEVNIG